MSRFGEGSNLWATYPTTMEQHLEGKCEAKLTAKGQVKLLTNTGDTCAEFFPGVDYKVEQEGGENWIALADVPEMQTMRHEWVLYRRRRPVAPHFQGCRVPSSRASDAETNAKLIMVYFHPWTMCQLLANDRVPLFVGLRARAGAPPEH